MYRLSRASHPKRVSRLEYLYSFLTILVIVISGNPAVSVLSIEAVYIGTLFIFLMVWLFRPVKFTGLDFMVVGCFVILALAHMLAFGGIAVAAELGFLVKLGIGLFAVRLIPKFSSRYIQVMYWLSIISFVLFIPLYLGMDMRSLFASARIPLPGTIHYHIGLYNLRQEYDITNVGIRNMGMFWEPGAFAGYLNLALFFIMRDGKLDFWRTRQGIIILIALLSTRSTSGYLALFMLVIFYAYAAGWTKNIAAKVIVWTAFALALMPLATVLFGQTAFLGDKISSQIEAARSLEDASRINRFGNILYDMKWIADKPLLGWSENPETRFAFDPEARDLAAGQGNGFTGFTVKHGIVGMLMFFLFFLYTTLKKSGSKTAAMFGFVVIVMLLNGEQFLGFPVFLSLMFLQQTKSTGSTRSPTRMNKVRRNIRRYAV